ncbi:biopolymer transporter ExbD [candidate division WOR-3 bacterium]|nr:biopolymer transporter ExbD [candidate division WOR-3 bacterium]
MNTKGLIGEINMTSLADVSITLLIIFIITAPMMTPGIDVNLPRTDASLPHDEQGITVSVNNELEIFIGGDKIEVVEFEARIAQILKTKPPGIIVYLRADKEVDYGFVVEVVGRMRKAGVKELGLVAEIPPE